MLKQGLQQKLLQKLSPQQIQLMKLLQLPTVAFEQRIKEELESNSVLDEGKESEDYSDDQQQDDFENNEVTEAEKEFDYNEYMSDDDTPSYRLTVNNRSADDEDKDIPFSGESSFQEVLEAQLSIYILPEEQKKLIRHLIGSLDESGYLRRNLDAIVDDLAFTQNINTSVDELEAALEILQQFDPAGVGARDLQECLLIQLRRKENDVATITAIAVLDECFEEFTKKHYDKILKKLDIEDEDLKNAIHEILKLNPKPGNSLNETTKTIQQITPDFVITINNGALELSLNGRNAPELRISRTYSNMLEAYSKTGHKLNKEQKDAMLFVKQKLDSARWFIDAVKQRQHTLYSTMFAIMELQHNYFLEGDETLLKPMILKDVAERVHLDISTISRVVNSKYVQTPYGTFLLKSFFSESLSTDSGEEVSTREVKKILQDLIEGEDKRKPITDEKLGEELNKKGYNIARRTVAKYREQLNLPVARLRKTI